MVNQGSQTRSDAFWMQFLPQNECCKFSIMDFSYAPPPPPHHHQMHRLKPYPQCDSKRTENAGDESLRRQAQRRNLGSEPPRAPAWTASFRGWRWEWLCSEGSWEKKQAVSRLSPGKRKVYHPQNQCQKPPSFVVLWRRGTSPGLPQAEAWARGPLRPRAGPAGYQLQVYHKGECEKLSHPRIPPMERTFRWGRAGSCRARQPGVMSNAMLYERMSFYTEFKFHIFNLIIQGGHWDHCSLGFLTLSIIVFICPVIGGKIPIHPGCLDLT